MIFLDEGLMDTIEGRERMMNSIGTAYWKLDIDVVPATARADEDDSQSDIEVMDV
jgi:hypothetical protein